MNEEIQQIRALFSSTNKDDVVLGIILMKKLNLFDELFTACSGYNYDATCTIPEVEPEARVWVIYEREMFYKSFNGFIGRTRGDIVDTLKYITLYYNDNSIPGI
jgi:hypothetical protein